MIGNKMNRYKLLGAVFLLFGSVSLSESCARAQDTGVLTCRDVNGSQDYSISLARAEEVQSQLVAMIDVARVQAGISGRDIADFKFSDDENSDSKQSSEDSIYYKQDVELVDGAQHKGIEFYCKRHPNETLDVDAVAKLWKLYMIFLRGRFETRQEAQSISKLTALVSSLHSALPQELTCADYHHSSDHYGQFGRLVWATAQLSDSYESDPIQRKSTFGKDSPILPPLDMSMDQAQAEILAWCSTHLDGDILNATKIYQAARLAKFGIEQPYGPKKLKEMAAQKAKDAEEKVYVEESQREDRIAARAGPVDSCPWNLALKKARNDRLPDSDISGADLNRHIWAWCAKHPDATASQVNNAMNREN